MCVHKETGRVLSGGYIAMFEHFLMVMEVEKKEDVNLKIRNIKTGSVSDMTRLKKRELLLLSLHK